MARKPSPKPITSFRIYPERRGLHFLVYVWPTKSAMLAHFRREHLHADRRTVAQCSTYRRLKVDAAGRMRTSPRMGEISFHLGRVTAEVLSHEVAHAALGWARRIGIRLSDAEGSGRTSQGLVSDAEERYCYGLGRMIEQVNHQFHRRGVWK